MAEVSKADGARRFTAVLVGLLALAIFINYLDRGNLATAGPLIKDELKLSNAQFGVLVSAFFWIYTPGQILASGLLQRFNPYRTLGLGLAIWSVATILTGFANGFVMLLGLRVLLGLGESAGFPASSKLLAQHLPPERLGLANALLGSGLMLGPAAGTFLGGLLVSNLGWRPLFLIFGGLSLLWLAPWLWMTRKASAAAATVARLPEPSFRELLSRRQLWGACIGHFATVYPFYLVASWLPLYLVKTQGYSLAAMAQLGGLVYLLSAATALCAGWAMDRWMARGASAHMARMSVALFAAVVSTGCMLACGLGGPKLAIAGLVLAAVPNGLGSFNVFAMGQTLAGPQAAGRWIGVQGAFANIAGIIAPILTGMIIDATGHFSLAFLAAATVALTGLGGYLALVRRVEPLRWSTDG